MLQVRAGRSERGSVLVLAMFFLILLSGLGLSLLSVADTEHLIAYNSLWAEGALEAAEAGVSACLNQLSANPDTSVAPIAATNLSTDPGAAYAYRSGTRTSGAAELTFVETRQRPGYSLGVGTGYVTSKYDFDVYQFDTTGTGPRNATRELQVRADYGPVPR
jgi:Tfp pilus assembly protein PilX